MAARTKLCLLGAGIFLLVGGFLWWGPYKQHLPPAFYVVFPVGAIFLGLFLLSILFEKEEQIYGEDQKRAAAKAGENLKNPPADRI